jgi:hypothetical protein
MQILESKSFEGSMSTKVIVRNQMAGTRWQETGSESEDRIGRTRSVSRDSIHEVAPGQSNTPAIIDNVVDESER